MNILQAENVRVLRGTVLTMVYDNHRRQGSHLSAIALGGALDRMHFDCSLNDLFTLLQDLRDRGYLAFEQSRDRWSGHVSINRIGITPAGRDLVERSASDVAVQLD